MDEAKPFDIPKREVWEAFKKVKANQGAAGVKLFFRFRMSGFVRDNCLVVPFENSIRARFAS